MLGGAAGMDFLDFFFFKDKIGLFFVVQAGAVVADALLALLPAQRTPKRLTAHDGNRRSPTVFPSYLVDRRRRVPDSCQFHSRTNRRSPTD
ncbi:MAG: hypothetical protein MZU97_04705 [Bacillus subtilis]|nr:hypothetical protein [Bacillus subtilis]